MIPELGGTWTDCKRPAIHKRNETGCTIEVAGTSVVGARAVNSMARLHNQVLSLVRRDANGAARTLLCTFAFPLAFY